MTKTKKPTTRITMAVMRRICDQLALGRSLRSVCDSDDTLPDWSPVLRKVQRDDEMYDMYSKARAIGAEFLMDEMFDLARKPLDDVERHLANAEVQRRRVHIDTLKWVFARMRPWDVRHRKEDVPEDNGGVIKLQWGGGQDHSQAEKPTADIIKLVKGDGDASK
tara:strand:- start:544 stop:1035 length:492 start_codon:yes stop_codon:yes gene_type:complete